MTVQRNTCQTAMQAWYSERGIEMQPTSGYSPQENGAAERLNRTLWESTLAMLADCGLPDKWWAEALVPACRLENVSSTGDMTPWEILKGEAPDLATLGIFGAPCMVKIPDEKGNKLQAKAEPGRLLGFDLPNTKAYKVLTAHGTVTRSRDVVDNEEFESKADRDMLDFDDAIAAPPTVPLAVPPTPTEPSIGQSTAPLATPPDVPAAPTVPDPVIPPFVDGDTSQSPQTGSHHRSGRTNKSVPPPRFDPAAFRLLTLDRWPTQKGETHHVWHKPLDALTGCTGL
jgi:hypothetical protein